MNTKEFARLCRVTKRTLFHYDEIGLLKPSVTHENGFREYSPEQLYKMDTIRIFQRAGYALTEIRDIYDLGPSEMEKQLKKARAILQERILELTRMRDFIGNKLDLYEDYKQSGSRVISGTYAVACEYRPENDREHFFSFLYDGFNEMILIGSEDQPMLQSGDRLKTVYGHAFFLEISSQDPDLIERIHDKIRENGLADPLEYHLSAIPHALIEKENTAIVRVIVPEPSAPISAGDPAPSPLHGYSR